MNTLYPEQQNAYNAFMDFLESPLDNFFLLEGHAGTGKTYLTAKLILELAVNQKIIATAPTHKAVKVISEEINSSTNPNLKFGTTHSALGLKEHIDGFGNRTFITDKMNPSKLSEYNILFVDEASMINKFLFDHIVPYTNNNLKVIFIGDPAQTPPVNDLNSYVFIKEIKEKYNIKSAKLSNIVRQSENNPIIKNTFLIREDLLYPNVLDKLTEEIIDNIGITLFKKDIDDDTVLILIDKLFNSNNFEKNQDYAKVIAWRNDTVDIYNNLIRYMIFNEESNKKILKNERLIADGPIIDENAKLPTILFNTNEEITIKNYDIQFEFINMGHTKIYYYNALAESIRFDKIYRKNIKILHEDSEKEFNAYLRLLIQNAKAEKQGTEKARTEWMKYYLYKNKYAAVKFNYAITVHKAQGSTYDNAFVIGWDINYNRNIEERNRILYTACSRPKYNLYLVK